MTNDYGIEPSPHKGAPAGENAGYDTYVVVICPGCGRQFRPGAYRWRCAGCGKYVSWDDERPDDMSERQRPRFPVPGERIQTVRVDLLDAAQEAQIIAEGRAHVARDDLATKAQEALDRLWETEGAPVVWGRPWRGCS